MSSPTRETERTALLRNAIADLEALAAGRFMGAMVGTAARGLQQQARRLATLAGDTEDEQ